MKFDHLLLIIAVTSAGFVRGESLLHEFARVHPTPSLETFMSFLHQHQQNPELCRSFTCTVHIERTPETSLNDWQTMIDHTSSLVQALQTSKNNAQDSSFLDLIGSPIKEWYELAGDKTGLHMKINIEFPLRINDGQNLHSLNDITKISIRIRVSHEKYYDTTAWRSIREQLISLIDNFEHNSSENFKPIRTDSLFMDIINTPHVTRSIQIKLKDNNKDFISFEFKK